MLKNILKIEGIQTLNKIEQKSLQGGRYGGNGACFYKNGQCCDTSSPNGVFCEAGRCTTYGCLWY
ncbi:hypothetical protein [uncultured Aquimarina sp.]|uniref:hypothetical protein n=1 Tax=uncultured Aquimarina sp. TaxID=575652 RepID=UPI002610E446|nr:hypothetical protein [uncultured Aquimarina sp.]